MGQRRCTAAGTDFRNARHTLKPGTLHGQQSSVMHCKRCEYPLWQLTDRICPECGTPFLPSEHEFILNSVRFCCPHCEMAYYGTGEKGHLVPRTFACVRCTKVIDMDEMVLLPTEGVTERQTQVTVVPWVERRERNWFTAFFATMGMAIGNPNRTIDAVPEPSGAWRAIGYMSVHVVLQTLMSGMPFIFWVIAMGAMAASGAGAGLGLFAAGLVSLVVAPVIVVLWAVIAHGLLRITGGTESGFRRTLHAFCYSAGNNFLMAVPCFGFYLSPFAALWWALSAGFMLSRAQKVSKLRGLLVTALPILLIIGLAIGGMVFAVMAAGRNTSAAMASVAMPTTWTSGVQAATGMSSRFQDYAKEGKPYPSHGAEMLVDSRSTPGEFILLGSRSTTNGCTVCSMTISQLGFPAMSGTQAFRMVLLADPALSGPAHRAGDWVFTYHGIKPTETDEELWLAVGWPDPALNPTDPATVPIALPLGKYDEINLADFDALLTKQNEVRAKHQLPALPHPRTVMATTKPVASPVRGAKGVQTKPRDASDPVQDDPDAPGP